jgi:hypothetical protein
MAANTQTPLALRLLLTDPLALAVVWRTIEADEQSSDPDVAELAAKQRVLLETAQRDALPL